MHTRLLPAVLVLTVMASTCPARVQLARSGQATAVIVSPHRIEAPPEGAAALGGILVKSAKSGNLLHQVFSGEPGLPIDALGWTASKGQYVFSPGRMISARPGSENLFGATADRDLAAPHRVTEDDPLTLEFIVEPPSGRNEEAWAYVRLHTAEGRRWTHGISITRQGKLMFGLAAEPNDPDRVFAISAEAGRVLDLQMVLGAKKVTWSWRNHGADEPWRKITSWGVAEPPTISGVRIVSMNHIDNTDRDLETARQVSMTRELKKLLERVTGATFDAVTEDDVPDGMARILVGDTEAIRALCPDVDFDRLGTDEILIRTVGNDLVLAGGRPRGIIYAITTFLQDHVGVRYWAPGAIDVPRDPDLAVPALNVRYRPPFDFRYFSGAVASKLEARAWHRISFDFQFDPGTHSIPHLLPKTLFPEHPDWFMYCPDDDFPNKKYNYQATLRGFQRTIETETDRTDLDEIARWIEVARKTRRLPQQPCLSSPGARQMITKNVMAELEQKYASWRHGPKVQWITANDGAYMCRCPDCEAVQQREGSDSANWVLMINEIAEKIEQKYPDVLVGTFAYLHTEAPPKTVRPHDNVLIYSALLRSNKRDPVEHYEKHAGWLRKWAAIAKHHWVWDYDANFRNYFQPHPNYFVHPQNMRFLRDIGASGVLVQAAHGKAADLAALRAWVTAQMMWNPDQDPRQLMVEFTNGYYGPAGRWIMLYVDLMLASVNRRSDTWLGCYKTDTTGWLELEDVRTAIDLLEQAARAVEGDEELSRRVWMARRHIDFAWLDRYDEFVKTAQEKGIPLDLPDPVKIVDSLAPYRNAWDGFREGPRPADFYVYFDRLRERFPAGVP